MAKPLTDAEKAHIMELHTAGSSQRQIARIVGRNRSTIQTVLAELSPTNALAKAHYAASALDLAKKATDKANVDQILEIHDRLGVLEKKRDASVGTTFQVLVGMPGQPAGLAPTQAQVDAAKALQPAPAPVIDVTPSKASTK